MKTEKELNKCVNKIMGVKMKTKPILNQPILNHDITFNLDVIENWIFRDGDKEYKFNKQEFIKRFCLQELKNEN